MATPRKIKLTFEVGLETEILISPEGLKEFYDNDWGSCVKDLYELEGQFWTKELKLVKVEEV